MNLFFTSLTMNNSPQKLIDLHQDVVSHLRGEMPTQTNLTALAETTELFFGSVFIEPENNLQTKEGVQKITNDIQWYQSLGNPFRVISNEKDLDYAKTGETGVVIHLEGADFLTPETASALAKWYNGGLRSIGFLWNKDNALGTSAASKKPDQGLTLFGKQVLKEANNLGIMIDCAHVNERGFYDILEYSKTPPFITHGNAYTLCPNPRNFTDNQIKVLAARGGIIGVFFSSKYVQMDRQPNVDDVIDHIAYIADLVGAESIAIGSDFGGITSGLIPGLEKLTDMIEFEERLRVRGFTDENIGKIFSDNALQFVKNFFTNESKK